MSVVNEVTLSAMDNLNDVLISLKSVDDMDVDYIKRQILKLKDSSDELEKEEKSILERRLGLYEKEIDRINKLVNENEKAIIQLDETALAISSVHTKEDDEMNKSMERLKELTEKVKEYSIKK